MLRDAGAIVFESRRMSDRPFLPYGRQSIDDDDIEAVVRVLRSDHLTTGPAVTEFEEALTQATGAPWAVAVSSGTSALHAACYAAGVGPGDEVIVPALTFLATANCARYVGAEPVFADVDADTGLIKPENVGHRESSRTKAVIAVHLTGATADIDGVQAALQNPDITIIEDAAHALGGTRGRQPVGACAGSEMAMFSFHPVKHATTGEGGAITGVNPVFEQRLRRFRNHGMIREANALKRPPPGPWYYEQHELGFNLRLSDIHAALGVSQLSKLEGFVTRRRALAARYDASFAEIEGVQPVTGKTHAEGSAYHLYSVLIDFRALGVKRAELMRWLRERQIGTQVHYIPLPMQPYYADRGWSAEDFPGARRYYERTLSLPLFPAMQDDDVDRVVGALEEGLRTLKR